MDWQTIKTSLREQVQRVSGLRTSWAGDKTSAGWAAASGTLTLNLVRVEAHGCDAVTEIESGDPDLIQYVVRGDRSIRIQLVAESPDLFVAAQAMDSLYADLLHCPLALSALNLAGINVSTRAPITTRRTCIKGKNSHSSIGDLTFNASIEHVCAPVPVASEIFVEASVLYPGGLTFVIEDEEINIT